MSQTQTRVYTEIPVSIMASASDPRSFRFRPALTSVAVTGPESVLQSLKSSDLSAYVQIPDSPLPRFSRKEIRISVPSDVAVTRIRPAEIEMEVITNSPPASSVALPVESKRPL